MNTAPFRRKPIFDTIRSVLSRPLRQSEVDEIDAAIDTSALDAAACLGDVSPQDRVTGVTLGADSGCQTPARSGPPVRIGPDGIALIKRFEGFAQLRGDGRVEAYPDPGTGGDPWTIGWGATGACHVSGGRIGPGTIWTRAECEARLERDLELYAAEVAAALGSSARTQAQFDALVSFHYNTGAIARATLTRKHRAGDRSGAVGEFARWNRAGGRVLRGLVRRREAEARLYRG